MKPLNAKGHGKLQCSIGIMQRLTGSPNAECERRVRAADPLRAGPRLRHERRPGGLNEPAGGLRREREEGVRHNMAPEYRAAHSGRDERDGPVVNSRDVAEAFEKEHRNILRDIEAAEKRSAWI